MKLFKTRPWVASLAVVAVLVSFAYAASYVVRYTVAGSQVYVMENDGTITGKGAFKFGSDQTTPALPTTTTADDFSIKVPFYNASGSTVSRGQIIIASNTASATGYGSVAALLSTTTVLGIADGTVSNGSIGFMSVGGYAAVLTTGTIVIGDLLVSTDTIAGYAGKIAPGTSVLAGAVIGKAVSATTAQGLTVVKLD